MIPAPLLVLGAGEDQLPVYREAVRRGIPTVGVDRSAERPALALADEFLRISTRDHEQIAAALANRELGGIATAASDACLGSVVELTRRFRLTEWVSGTAARTSMDKSEFRRVTTAAGIAAPAWHAGTVYDKWPAIAGRLGYPLVVKPVDASGSHGASLVTSPAALDTAVAAAAAASPSGRLIAEWYVAGRNLTVELFMICGSPAFLIVSEKRLGRHAHFVISGHSCPADLQPDHFRRVAEQAVAIATAMDVQDGPVNIDFILTQDGSPIVLEAGARLCGNGVPGLVRAMSGVDTVAAMVSLALGEPVRLAATNTRHGLLHVLASPLPHKAVVACVRGLAEVRALPGVAFVELYVTPGDHVQPFTRSAHKMGYIGVVGDIAADAERSLRAALAAIHIELRPQQGTE